MLNQMRTIAGSWLAKLLLLMLILSFIIWGVGDMLRGPGANSPVATVGGEKITIMEYQRTLRSEMENIRRSLGEQYSPELLKNLNVPQMVLKRMINQKLMRLDSHAQGLIPGDSDIARRIRLNPMFADQNGNFSKDKFAGMLRAMGRTEKSYIEDMRSELASNMMMDSIGAAAHVSDKEIEVVYQALEEQRVATLYTFNASDISDVGTPEAKELEAYYNDHAQTYSTPEYRTFSYVVVTQDNIRSNIKISDDELRAAYKERSEEFKRGERRVVDQLLFASEEKAQKALEQIKGGKNFAQVAKQADILNKDSVSLGPVERGHMLEGAEESVFALPVGGVTDIIKSPFGYHIFHVAKIEPASSAEFSEVKSRLEKDVMQTRFEDELGSYTNKLQDMLAGGTTLPEAAKELGLTLKTTEAVTAQGEISPGQKAKSIPELDKFLETGFKTDEKTESSLIMSKDGKYYILRTDSVNPTRVRPLEEIKGRVVADWQKQQRLQKLAVLAKGLRKQFDNADSRSAAIAKYKAKTTELGAFKQGTAKVSGVALPAPMVEDIFLQKPGRATDAYPIDADSYAVAVVKTIIPADKKSVDSKNDADSIQIRKNLEQQQADELIDQYMRYLGNRYSVTVNESVLEMLTKNADQ